MPKLGRVLSLLIGGARSGKSDLAVALGEAWPLEAPMFSAEATLFVSAGKVLPLQDLTITW